MIRPVDGVQKQEKTISQWEFMIKRKNENFAETQQLICLQL